MISRVIEAKATTCARSSRRRPASRATRSGARKPRRASRDTRENLERLQDLRDEVDKQIRHLQRQAATARRYQALKEEERRLHGRAAGAAAARDRQRRRGARPGDPRECDLRLQQALAEQRARRGRRSRSSASFQRRRQRARAREVQGRYYQLGAEISAHRAVDRAHARAARAAAQRAGAGRARRSPTSRATSTATSAQVASCERRSPNSRPELEQRAAGRSRAARRGARRRRRRSCTGWQQRWESFNRELGATHQTDAGRARAHRAAREPAAPPAQRRRDRLAVERDDAGRRRTPRRSSRSSRAANARRAARQSSCRAAAHAALACRRCRRARSRAEQELEATRAARRDRARTPKAGVARGAAEGGARRRRPGGRALAAPRGLASQPRLAAQLAVDGGWERAVETVLGDYLEAVCVESIDEVAGVLDEPRRRARVRCVEGGRARGSAATATASLRACVRARRRARRAVERVVTVDTLAEALRAAQVCSPDESLVTRDGVWIGRDWLRVPRRRSACRRDRARAAHPGAARANSRR